MMKMGRNVLIVSIDLTVKQLARKQAKQKPGEKQDRIFINSRDRITWRDFPVIKREKIILRCYLAKHKTTAIFTAFPDSSAVIKLTFSQ